LFDVDVPFSEPEGHGLFDKRKGKRKRDLRICDMSLDISCLNRCGIFTLEYRQLGKSYLVGSMDGLR